MSDNDRYWLELFLARYLEVREMQKIYFSTRSKESLKASKALEEATDQLAKQLIKKGYNPDEFLKAKGIKRLM